VFIDQFEHPVDGLLEAQVIVIDEEDNHIFKLANTLEKKMFRFAQYKSLD